VAKNKTYLENIFAKLNEINLSLQEKHVLIFTKINKISSFKKINWNSGYFL
jgi:hypothetical protein